MPVIPVGFFQITHIFGGAALPFGAVVTYGVDEEGNHTPLGAATACHNLFELHLLPRIVADIELRATLAKAGPNATGAAATYTETDTGGQAGPALPANVAWLVEKLTASGGRRGRGRMFIPGVPEADAGSDGAIAAGEVTSWNTALEAFRAGLVTEQLPMVVLHDNSLAPTNVTALVLDPVAATQRQRMRR